MTQAPLLLLLSLLSLLSFGPGCGRYGPPVRAGQVEPKEPAPSIELPLPEASEVPAKDQEVEEEPPPEGTP